MEIYSKRNRLKFTQAIVRQPGKSLVRGLTSANLGLPDYTEACIQHEAYIHALETCGLRVQVLPPNDLYPDSTFVEDVALITSQGVIITNPGAPSRKGEVLGMKDVLAECTRVIGEIRNPGTLEGGDVMMVGSHFYIGLSERTNPEGAQQAIDILSDHGMSGSLIKLKEVLHLKTGVAYLEDNNLVVCGEFKSHPEFHGFNLLEIEEDECYAANCVWVNGRVLVPASYPKAKVTIESAGYETITVDVSEFRKLDGGLSCLSLRF